MAFKKGKPKTGGRQKGTPNKRRTIFESLEEIQTVGGQPVDVVKLFFEGLMDMPSYQRVDALLDFMKFLYPTQKALEIGNKDESGFKIIIEDYAKK
jgi:hypothetical protein